LHLPPDVTIVSKGTARESDAYSAFTGTDLAQALRDRGIRRLWIGGLATDYCVAATVFDALAAGFEGFLLQDAIRAVDVKEGDGDRAIARMREAGAVPVRYTSVTT
jgi:nicotinamidase/pyrazinamidase